MSENGHKHGEYDASADAFVINKTNAKSVQSETNIAEQEQPAVIKTSNKEPFDTKYAVKTIPLDYDDADICCTCGGISWRPRAHCVSATVFCIMLAIILPVTLIDKSDSSRAVGLVPTVAPTSETEILAVDDELLTEAPSDFLTEEPSEIAIFVTTVPHTTVPIAAPVVIMPVLTLSPTDAVTDIVPVDTVVTDTPTTLTPTSLSPTPLPTAEQPSPNAAPPNHNSDTPSPSLVTAIRSPSVPPTTKTRAWHECTPSGNDKHRPFHPNLFFPDSTVLPPVETTTSPTAPTRRAVVDHRFPPEASWRRTPLTEETNCPTIVIVVSVTGC